MDPQGRKVMKNPRLLVSAEGVPDAGRVSTPSARRGVPGRQDMALLASTGTQGAAGGRPTAATTLQGSGSIHLPSKRGQPLSISTASQPKLQQAGTPEVAARSPEGSRESSRQVSPEVSFSQDESPFLPSPTSETRNVIKDGDKRCVHGALVRVADEYANWDIFKKFAGKVGRLTFRHHSGMWYASFAHEEDYGFLCGPLLYQLQYSSEEEAAEFAKKAEELRRQREAADVEHMQILRLAAQSHEKRSKETADTISKLFMQMQLIEEGLQDSWNDTQMAMKSWRLLSSKCEKQARQIKMQAAHLETTVKDLTNHKSKLMSAQQTIREKELQAIEAEKEIATKDEELRVARITVQTALKDKEETIVLEEHKTAEMQAEKERVEEEKVKSEVEAEALKAEIVILQGRTHVLKDEILERDIEIDRLRKNVLDVTTKAVRQTDAAHDRERQAKREIDQAELKIRDLEKSLEDMTKLKDEVEKEFEEMLRDADADSQSERSSLAGSPRGSLHGAGNNDGGDRPKRMASSSSRFRRVLSGERSRGHSRERDRDSSRERDRDRDRSREENEEQGRRESGNQSVGRRGVGRRGLGGQVGTISDRGQGIRMEEEKKHRSKLLEFKQKIPALEGEISMLKLQITSMEPAVQAAATIPALQEAVDDANREASKLRDDVSRRRADIKDRKEDIRQLEIKVENLNQEAFALTQKLEKTEAEREVWKGKSMDFEAQSIELRENLETTEGRNVQLGVEQMDLRSQLERTSNALAEATEKISTLESDTRSLAKGLGESKRTEENFTSLNKGLSNEVAEMSQKIAAMQTEEAKLKKMMEAQEKKAERRVADLQEELRYVTTLKAEFEAYKVESNKIHEQLKVKVSSHVREMEEVQDELAQSRHEWRLEAKLVNLLMKKIPKRTEIPLCRITFSIWRLMAKAQKVIAIDEAKTNMDREVYKAQLQSESVRLRLEAARRLIDELLRRDKAAVAAMNLYEGGPIYQEFAASYPMPFLPEPEVPPPSGRSPTDSEMQHAIDTAPRPPPQSVLVQTELHLDGLEADRIVELQEEVEGLKQRNLRLMREKERSRLAAQSNGAALGKTSAELTDLQKQVGFILTCIKLASQCVPKIRERKTALEARNMLQGMSLALLNKERALPAPGQSLLLTTDVSVIATRRAELEEQAYQQGTTFEAMAAQHGKAMIEIPEATPAEVAAAEAAEGKMDKTLQLLEQQLAVRPEDDPARLRMNRRAPENRPRSTFEEELRRDVSAVNSNLAANANIAATLAASARLPGLSRSSQRPQSAMGGHTTHFPSRPKSAMGRMASGF